MKTAAALFLLGVLLAGCPKSPVDQIQAAEAAMQAARDAGAPDCATPEYQSAEEMMARTYRLNNDKEYDDAKRSAETAQQLAEVARVEAARNTRCVPGTKGAGKGSGGAGDGDGVRLGGRSFTEAEVAAEIDRTRTGEGALGEGSIVEGLRPVGFGFDDANLSPEALEIVKANAEWIQARPSVRVQIEGHTDERGTGEYNLALGERRAGAVREALIRLGVEADRMTTISYGEEMPVSQAHDESGWSENRRAEFVVK